MTINHYYSGHVASHDARRRLPKTAPFGIWVVEEPRVRVARWPKFQLTLEEKSFEIERHARSEIYIDTSQSVRCVIYRGRRNKRLKHGRRASRRSMSQSDFADAFEGGAKVIPSASCVLSR